MEPLVRFRAWFEGGLSVKAKLLAALAAALLPALALGSLWAAQINNDRLFTAKERAGVAYLKAVWPIFHAATQDRVVIAKEPLHSFVRARIGHDDAMDTAPESAALRAAINRQADPATLTGAALTLIAAIGDGSNLILDPELPSYYLMDLAVLSLPELASEADGYARSRGPLRPETWAQLYSSAGALNANLDNVRRSETALAKADPLAAQRLEAPLRRIYASGELLRDAALAIAQSQGAEATPAQLAELRTQERQFQGAIDLCWHAVIAELDAALAARERQLEQSLAFAVLFGLVLISLAIFVVGQAGRSLRLPLDRLGAVMNAMAARGDTTVAAPFQTYSNEIGTMARSVEVFRQAMQRADALALTLEAERAALERRVEERTAALAEAVEAAQAASKAKSTFLATMSHEIRTPLNGVLGMADALRSTALPADAVEMVETIQTSGRSLLAILNDVLDISKVEAGKLSLERAPFAL
ncbi:histidine kinase dimerization/phospho-acceptor domain-containing protein, partial [Aphanothece microscopica]|uniref:histidine kinase dimerization/phospho-acceptor domain-containing protein n=1 Tax=Aphanothece microscopica TaxID=1049561 RepID=UPI00398531F6